MIECVHIQRRSARDFASGIAVVFWRDGKGHFYHPITNTSLNRLRRALDLTPHRYKRGRRGELFYRYVPKDCLALDDR